MHGVLCESWAGRRSPGTPKRAVHATLALVCIALVCIARVCIALPLAGPALADPVVDDSAASATPWPGPSTSRAVDQQGVLGPDLSGLAWVEGDTSAADRVFAARDDGLIHRLRAVGSTWQPDTGQGWGRGKAVTFPDGSPGPDIEGIAVRNQVAWLSVERDAADAARPSILRVPVTGTATTLQATDEWNLSAHYPGINANLGPEAMTLVPNEVLVAAGFVDETSARPFSPADYPDQRGSGVFLVAVEAPGLRRHIDAFVLRDGGGSVKVASFVNPIGLATELDFDASTGQVWATCDDFCDVRAAIFEVGDSGRFEVIGHHSRPAGLPNLNFEGFTVAPLSRCAAGMRPVLWANDANNAGRALWSSQISCPSTPGQEPPVLRLTKVASRAGVPTVLDVAVGSGGAGDLGGSVTLTVGSLRATAPVLNGMARVPVGVFRTAGTRAWSATWTSGPRTARASGTVGVAKARTTLRAARAVVRVKRGSRARVVVHLAAGATPTPGKVRVKVSAAGRGRFVAADVKRIGSRAGTQRSVKVVVRTPRLRGSLARTPIKVVVLYGGSRHTTSVSRAVTVRVR